MRCHDGKGRPQTCLTFLRRGDERRKFDSERERKKKVILRGKKLEGFKNSKCSPGDLFVVFFTFFAGDKACCSTKITFDKRAVVLQGIASSDAYLVMNTNTRHRICHAAQMQ